MLSGVNNSFITLVPKKFDASGLGDDKPISLVNSLCKPIVALEAIHHFKVKEKSSFLLKIDFRKVYDSIS